MEISEVAERDDSRTLARASYRPLPGVEDVVADDGVLEELRTSIDKLLNKKVELGSHLDKMDQLFASKRKPYEEEMKFLVQEHERLSAELQAKMAPSPYPPAPGPSEFAFVDSTWFGIVCNVVVVLNLLCMALSSKLQAYSAALYIVDQLFLVWYVFELSAKFLYHRWNLFFGRISVVWWNWLDAIIVLAGVVDQWAMLLLKNVVPITISSFSRLLRALRVFRVLRSLKVLKAFLQGDMSWTEEAPFQLLMAAVIAVNSVVMSLELDYDWAGWFWFEHAFLVIYTFELAVRLKAFGCQFFVNADLIWNNLDFIMCCGGAFSMWCIPAWSMIDAMIHGTESENKGNSAVNQFVKILRMAKILRVLRLVRLLKMVKPLYNLLLGVMAALDAMKWVVVLTLLVLYAGAIVFTSLIGHGYMYGNVSDVPPEAEIYFGSVPASFFSLFKLMNGDTSVVEPVCSHVQGRLLFAGFMVISNWAVLAILTSVVSDHMIASSQKLEEEDKEKDAEEMRICQTRQLKDFFSRTLTGSSLRLSQMEKDIDGSINNAEWAKIIRNADQKQELLELTGLDEEGLDALFYRLAEEPDMSPASSPGRPEKYLRCKQLIDYLNHDEDVACQKHITQLRYWLDKITTSRMQELDLKIQGRLQEMSDTIGQALGISSFPKSKSRDRQPSGDPALPVIAETAVSMDSPKDSQVPQNSPKEQRLLLTGMRPRRR